MDSKAKQILLDTQKKLLDAKINPKTVSLASTGGGGSIQHVPTGILALDLATLGGLYVGRINYFASKKAHSGKTTAAWLCIAAFQRAMPDKIAVYVETEGALDVSWGQTLGVDLDRLIVAQPETGEQACEIVDEYMGSTDISLIVLDSVHGAQPTEMIQTPLGEYKVASQARMFSRAVVQWVNTGIKLHNEHNYKPTILAVNQTRTGIGAPNPKYAPTVHPGGDVWEYYASFRAMWANIEDEIDSDSKNVSTHALTSEFAFKVIKNKGGNGLKRSSFTLVRDPAHPSGVGAILQTTQMINFAKQLGLVEEAGSKGIKIPIIGLEGPVGNVKKGVPEREDSIIHKIEQDQQKYTDLYMAVLEKYRATKAPNSRKDWLWQPPV